MILKAFGVKLYRVNRHRLPEASVRLQFVDWPDPQNARQKSAHGHDC